MLKELKKTSKHTAIYAVGNTAIKLIGLFLIPLYTNADYLSHDDFGALSILEATSQITIGVLTMAMIQSLTRWYWDKKYAKQQKSVFFTSMGFLACAIVPIALLILSVAEKLTIITLGSSEYTYLFQLTIIASIIQILNNQILCLAKLQSKSTLYISAQIGKLILTLGLILWGILRKGQGLEAIWQANLVGEIVILLLLLPYTIKNSSLKIHFEILQEMLSYGLPLMLASVSGVLLATVDRYMLSSMSSLENTGIYSIGFRIANTLKVIVTTSLALALSPLKMKKINEPDHHRFYSKTNTYTLFIFSIGLLAISLFSLEFIKLFTGSDIYWKANAIVPIIAFSLFFGLFKDNVLIGLAITKKTKIIGTLIFLTSLLNIGLNVVLIPTLDIYGAALATLLSQIFFFASITISSQRAYPISYEWKKIALMITFSVLIITGGLAITPLSLGARLLVKLSLLTSYPFILNLFKFYDKNELEQINTIFQTWRKPSLFIENIKRLVK